VEGGAARRTVGGLSLGAILVATALTLALGGAFKARCASGDWADGRQYVQLCYSDIVPLYGTEHLTGGRLPYLNPCPPGASLCDEYPVLTMYFMRVAGWVSRSYAAFFWSNAILLSVCALLTAWALYRMVGERALYFAVAPTLFIYGFVNWDLLVVALATVGTLAYLRSRDGSGGALLGLGTAAKFYPALFVIPFAVGRIRQRRGGAAVSLAAWALAAYAAVNLVFVMAAPSRWATFFVFNARRAVDWDSLWFVACQRLHGGTSCSWSPRTINGLSLIAFLALATLLWWWRASRQPDFPRWTLGFPILVAFLLTNKVYSPQYGLWLLPWFALALPNPWLFGAFELADVAVFITRFSWFGRLSRDAGNAALAGYHGVPLGGFEVALVIRAVVLLACLVAWVRQVEPGTRNSSTPPTSTGDTSIVLSSG
jgi:uncharacterized membrane protein